MIGACAYSVSYIAYCFNKMCMRAHDNLTKTHTGYTLLITSSEQGLSDLNGCAYLLLYRLILCCAIHEIVAFFSRRLVITHNSLKRVSGSAETSLIKSIRLWQVLSVARERRKKPHAGFFFSCYSQDRQPGRKRGGGRRGGVGGDDRDWLPTRCPCLARQ